MKKYSIVFVMLLATVIIASCSRGDDYMISQSVFIEDETNPGLPVYSEWGYNAFGVYWDRASFVSERYNVPTKIVVEKDSCYWLFNGRINGSQYTLTFAMPDYLPAKYEDLVSLNSKKINLADESLCCVFLNNEKLRVLEGEFEVKRAQKLYVDKELSRTILSGIFVFKAMVNEVPSAFSSGRFDLGIGYDNFFNLQ